MDSSEISTSADIVLDHAFGNHIFDLLVPVLGKWDLAVIFLEKDLDPGVTLEDTPRRHHKWPILRFVFAHAPREVDPGEFQGPFTKSCFSPGLLLSSLFRFNHFFQLREHFRVPICENDQSKRVGKIQQWYIYR